MNWKNFIKTIGFCIIMLLLIYFSYIPIVFFIDALIGAVCGIYLLLFFLNLMFYFWR